MKKVKKVLIIGASGSLAAFVIEALKQKPEIALTLFLRKKSRLKNGLVSGCTVIEGDATDYMYVKEAVMGHDIVYVNLSGDLKAMAANIVRAMQETGVSRIIAISSIGIYDIPMKPILRPYRELADIIESSGLDYTILRPDWFTYGSEIDYIITRKGEQEKGQAISRKSIASLVAGIVEDPEIYMKENLGISKPG